MNQTQKTAFIRDVIDAWDKGIDSFDVAQVLSEKYDVTVTDEVIQDMFAMIESESAKHH